jgi:glycerol-3-phosphate O-acyltransferase/dihydroxyacetone phosphate acyltransferase
MLYAILNMVVWVALKIFFRKIRIEGKENIPRSGSVIVVANHPNTFMDPILAALVMLPKQVHFLANGSIFKTAIARLVLSQLNTIPIYRQQDKTDNRQQQNEKAFRKCFDFLIKGGILLIFPEGNSINERNLRPLKTGTARIALGAEQEQNFELPLFILPIGLNYSKPTHFREEVAIKVGKPVDVRTYLERYQADQLATVTELTTEVHQRISSLIIVTENKQEDDLVRKIEMLYKKQISISVKENVLDVNLTQNIIKAVNYFRDHKPILVREIKDKIDNYFQTIQEFNLSDYLVEKSEGIRSGKVFRYMVYFITGFPLYVAGLIFNYIPYSIPSKIANWISKDEEYRAPIMMTAGIITFPIYYAVMYSLGWKFLPSLYIILGLTIVMPLSGFFVLKYYSRLRNLRSTFVYHRIFKKEKTTLDWFTQQRQEIINLLESARQQYQ